MSYARRIGFTLAILATAVVAELQQAAHMKGVVPWRADSGDGGGREREIRELTCLSVVRGGKGPSQSFIGRVLRSWRDSGSAAELGKGGIVGRVQRFLRSLLWGEKVTAAKSKTRITTHLSKKFKTGNANVRIQKELRGWLQNPTENIAVSVGDNLRVWVVTLTGAKGTVFAGEKYKLKVTFPTEYPTKPPSVYFLQPTPRHEHVYTNGDICLNLLGKDWRPHMNVRMLALAILSMLSSAKEKKIPLDNQAHADAPPGKAQENWLYHDDRC